MNTNLFWDTNITCEFCDATFNDQDNLKQHLRLHSRRKPYKCNECDAKFSYNSTLEWHKKSHSGVMPFKCDECGAQFLQNSMLVWHKRKHNLVDTSQSQAIVVNMANIYQQSMPNFPNMLSVPSVNGTTTTVANTVPVSMCPDESGRDISLQPGSQMNTCILVPFSSQSSTTATSSSGILFDLLGKRKLDSEEGTFRCDICCTVFAYSSDLKTHMVTKHNMGENNPFNILAKQQLHTDGSLLSRRKVIVDKPFKCDLCFAGFNTEGHLKSHRQKHTVERPYKCLKCGLSYSDKNILESHERRHQADRPYKCDRCGAAFFRESHLQKHIKRHTGEIV